MPRPRRQFLSAAAAANATTTNICSNAEVGDPHPITWKCFCGQEYSRQDKVFAHTRNCAVHLPVVAPAAVEVEETLLWAQDMWASVTSGGGHGGGGGGTGPATVLSAVTRLWAAKNCCDDDEEEDDNDRNTNNDVSRTTIHEELLSDAVCGNLLAVADGHHYHGLATGTAREDLLLHRHSPCVNGLLEALYHDEPNAWSLLKCAVEEARRTTTTTTHNRRRMTIMESDGIKHSSALCPCAHPSTSQECLPLATPDVVHRVCGLPSSRCDDDDDRVEKIAPHAPQPDGESSDAARSDENTAKRLMVDPVVLPVLGTFSRRSAVEFRSVPSTNDDDGAAQGLHVYESFQLHFKVSEGNSDTTVVCRQRVSKAQEQPILPRRLLLSSNPDSEAQLNYYSLLHVRPSSFRNEMAARFDIQNPFIDQTVEKVGGGVVKETRRRPFRPMALQDGDSTASEDDADAGDVAKTRGTSKSKGIAKRERNDNDVDEEDKRRRRKKRSSRWVDGEYMAPCLPFFERR